MSFRSTLACALLPLLAGCGAPARIFTGGEAVQLGATLTEGFVPYSVPGELGHGFLHVDGRCGFAVRTGAPLAPELVGGLAR